MATKPRVLAMDNAGQATVKAGRRIAAFVPPTGSRQNPPFLNLCLVGLKMIRTTRAFICIGLFFSALVNSAPDEPKGEWGLVTADRVNLRSEPSLSAAVKVQMELGSWVAVTNDTMKSDNRVWRRVVFSGCSANGKCGPGDIPGWVAEEYVAPVSSFTRVNSWTKQIVQIGSPETVDVYNLNADGTFEARLGAHQEKAPTSDTRKGGLCSGTEKGAILRNGRFFLLQRNETPLGWVQAPNHRLLMLDDKTNRLCHRPIAPGPDECTSNQVDASTSELKIPALVGVVINECIEPFSSYIGDGKWGKATPLAPTPPSFLAWSVAERGYPPSAVKMTLPLRQLDQPLHHFTGAVNEVVGIAVSSSKLEISALSPIETIDPFYAQLAAFIKPITEKEGIAHSQCEYMKSDRPVLGVSLFNAFCGHEKRRRIQIVSRDGKNLEVLKVSDSDDIVGALALEGSVFIFTKEETSIDNPLSYCVTPLSKSRGEDKYCECIGCR